MNGCEIWSYDGSTWRCVVGPAGAWARGFGDPKNYGVGCLTVFDGQLYVGVNNLSGLQVWRTADGTHWNRVDGYFRHRQYCGHLGGSIRGLPLYRHV